MSGAEGVTVNGGTPVAEVRPGRNDRTGIFIIKCAGRSAYKKCNLPTSGKNKLSPVFNLTFTPSLFPVCICLLSAATLGERIW